jgi:hypothetical protein
MRTIFKYPISITDTQTIEVRKESGTTCEIIHVGLDPSGTPCVWIELTPGDRTEKLAIHIIGTGNPVRGTKAYICSFVQSPFVWHVYI